MFKRDVSEWISYPPAGHLPMEENIEQFNADLLNFLEQTGQH